jgi:hypothetical protein
MATLSTEESLCADLGRVTSLTQSIKGGCREGFFTSESASGLVQELLSPVFYHGVRVRIYPALGTPLKATGLTEVLWCVVPFPAFGVL